MDAAEISTPQHQETLVRKTYKEKASIKPDVVKVYYERRHSKATGKEKFRKVTVLANGSKYSRPCGRPDADQLKKQKIELRML